MIRTKVSRNTDPESSHIAEEAITQSGKRQNQIDQIVAYVTNHPGSTSGEIAAGLGGDWNNVAVSRRLSDAKDLLLKQGDSRKCAAKGTKMCSWWLVAGFKSMGQFNAMVEKGATREERITLLESVPEVYRESVRNHVMTVFGLKKRAEIRKRR